MISDIPLDQLSLSPLNPRQAEPTEVEIEALAASIEAEIPATAGGAGLIQNLVAHRLENGFGVADGGRRLRALQLLASRGVIASDQAIPCLVLEDRVEISAATANINRRPLGAVEEFRAYAALVKAAANVEEIAAALSVTPRHVRQRLKLAGVHPDILAAYEAGGMSENLLQAFTVTDDQKRQLKVFRSEEDPRWLNAHAIRQALSPKDNDRTARALDFVGAEAYLAAGGRLTEDLFSQHLVIHDPQVVRDLVEQRLAGEMEKLRGEGWRWVEALPTYDWNALRAYPAQVEAGEIDARDAAQVARTEEIEAKEREEGQVSAEEAEEHRQLCRVGASPHWTEAQRALSGVVVYPNGNRISAEFGLVRDEGLEDAIAAGLIQGARPGAAAATDGRAEAPAEKPAFAAALLDELRAINGLALRTLLMAKPDLALDVLTLHFAGARGVLSEHHVENRLPAAEGFGAMTVEKTLGRIAPIEADLVGMQARGKKARNGALAAAVARRLVNRLPGESANFDQAFAQAAPDPAAAIRVVWTPDEAFFKRLKLDQLVAIFESLAESAPGECGLEAKKGVIARTLGRMFTDAEAAGAYPTAAPKLGKWIPEPLEARP